MTKKTILKNDNTSSITEFKYDETNKLYEIILPNDNKRLEFKYDNGGQRIVKEFKDGCTTINKNVYVNGFYEKINDAVNKHISDGKYIFATILDNDDDNIIYYSQNNIGSTTLLTNNNGEDIGQFLYTPFGEFWVEEASEVDISHITRFFTNQQYDKESGLYYYNARYYDPHLGSFITPDPGMDQFNHYNYCNSNPIKYTDPTGLTARIGSRPLDIPILENLYDPLRGPFYHEHLWFDDGFNRGFFDLDRPPWGQIREDTRHTIDDYDFDRDLTEYDEDIMREALENVIDNWDLDWSLETHDCKDFMDALREEYNRIVSEREVQELIDAYEQIREMLEKMENEKNNTQPKNDPKNPDPNPNPQPTPTPTTESSGTKIICTELYKQGLLDEKIYKADQEFGKYLEKNNPIIMNGYHFLAKPIVKLMQMNKTITKIVYVIAKPWADEMAYQMGYKERGNIIGKVIMWIGIPICYLFGIIFDLIKFLNIFTLLSFLMLLILFISYILKYRRKYLINQKKIIVKIEGYK